MKVKSHRALLIIHIETIDRCYLPESLRYTSLLLYDVTPVSQRKTQYFNPDTQLGILEVYHTFIGTINNKEGQRERHFSPCQRKTSQPK